MSIQPNVEPEVVQRLLRFRSSSAPVLSVYVGVPPDPGEIRGIESRFHSVLKPVRELADGHGDDLDHYARQSLRSDVERVLGLPGRGAGLLGRGVAVFGCHREGLYEEVVLPRVVRPRAVVDATPYLRPLMALLDESHRYCVLVIDRERAWLHEFWMGRLEEERKVLGESMRKRDYAGWHGLDERTTMNRAEQLARRHFHSAADTVADFMARSGTELLVVGGHQETVANFTPFLPRHLQARLAGTFVTDPSTMTPAKLRDQADEVVERYERDEERRLVTEALARVEAGGRAAAGLEWCLAAANEHAIDLLLVHDEEVAGGRVCDACGWIGLGGEACPVTGDATRPTSDVIEELAAAVVDTGGQVEHVFAETDLARHTVAASLRFPVPAPAASATA